MRGRHSNRTIVLWLAAAACVALLMLVAGTRLDAFAGAPSAAVGGGAAQEHIGGEPLQPENAQEVSRQSVHGEPITTILARLVNFAILVGVLVYFLRAPIGNYLARRSTEIRADLVKAAETRQAAEAELAAIDEKMKRLPSDLDAMRARGAQETAAEEARIRQVAEAERTRLLEQARREIELQLRAAERDLIKRAAELTVGLASERIKRTITDDDRRRLVDQYLAQVQSKS